jgi:nucleotide-binding universal stress UspA family protein
MFVSSINRILLATDFSDTAANAAQFATRIAADNHAEIHVLTVHVINGTMPDVNASLYEDAEKRLENYGVDGDVKAVKAIRTGVAAAPVIVEYAQTNAVDLIIIGTHARRGLARFFIGSVASEVVRSATQSVLVIDPAHTVFSRTFDRIMAPVDFSQASLAALREAEAIAQRHEARLQAVHVVESPTLELYSQSRSQNAEAHAREALAAFLDTAALAMPVAAIVTLGSPHTRIAELADENDVDLIVMGAKGRGAVERLLLGSTTDRVLRMAPCPVLVHRGEQTAAF